MREAVRLFARKGYEGTSVRETVEAAAVTKPTLYYYFASKEGLCEAVLEDGTARFEALVSAPAGGCDAAERLTEWMLRSFRFCRQNKEFVRFVYSLVLGAPAPGARTYVDRMHKALRSGLEREVASLVAAGAIDEDRADAMVWTTVATVNACIMMQIRAGRNNILTRELAQERMRLLCEAVGRKGAPV